MPGDPKSATKINQLIECFKQIATSVGHENDKYEYLRASNLHYLSKQIIQVFEYEHPSSGHRIFMENWQQLFDAFFEVFTKALRNDVRAEFPRIDLREICTKSKSKFKDLKQFNSYLFSKLTELTRFLNKHYKEIDSRSILPSCLDCYYDFSYSMVDYISHDVSDVNSYCKPCVEYLVELSKGVHLSTDYLRVMYDLLWKENFFVLKDLSNETVEITQNVLDVTYQFVESDGDLDDLQKKRYEYLTKCLNYLKKRVEKFPESKRAAQECLFEKTFYKPVILNIQSENFFDLMQDEIFDLTDPATIYETCRPKFEKLLAFFIANGFLEAIQPNQGDNSGMILYFTEWFKKLGQVLKTASTCEDKFVLSLLEIMKKVEQIDNYVDPFDTESMTINFYIIRELSDGVFDNPKSNDKLVTGFLQFWIKLYEKHNSNRDIAERFFDFITAANNNFSKFLIPFASKLWEFYLAKMDKYQLMMTIETILPSTHALFMQNYSKRFTQEIFKNFDQNFLNVNLLLIKIIKSCPQYFFQVDNDQLLLTRYIEKSKNVITEHVFSSMLSLANLIISALKDNSKLGKELNSVLFKHRLEFWTIIYTKKPNSSKYDIFRTPNFNSDWIVLSIGEIYYILMRNLSNKDNKSVVKTFIDEFLFYFDNTEPRSQRPFQIIDVIRGLGEFENKKYAELLREHRERFVELRKEAKSDPNAMKSVDSVLDLIDDRNLQTFSKKLDVNEKKIEQIDEDLAAKGAEIRVLDTNIRTNEQKVSELKGEVVQINERVDAMSRRIDEQNTRIDQLDQKTLFNMPPWCKNLRKSMKKNRQDWILVAKRLNFSDRDIKAWLNQIEPFMSMLQEWFIANKTSDAIAGLMKVYKELGNKECVQIIQENIDRIEAESKSHFKDYNIDDKMKKNPAHVFICFEMSSIQKAELVQRYLFERLNQECGVTNLDESDNRINIWFDDGRMGGGVERNKRIDLGVRLCKVLVCLITAESIKDQTCLNQINLAVQLNKQIIPLLLDSKLKWPPSGSLGPILSEYLFVRFFQRPPKELTNDERYWPVDKFNELVMQLKQLIPFSLDSGSSQTDTNSIAKEHPEVFISYQWDKQKDIIKLYDKLTSLGIKCWLDIYQMGGGDSLYFKIDEGIRNCCVVISCVTMRYSQSANCRKEIALSDSVSKPIVPILIEKGLKYPPSGPMSPTLGVLKYIDFTKNINPNNQEISWDDKPFKDLLMSLKPHLAQKTVDVVTSRACIIS